MASIARTVRLTAAESFWYVLQCIAFGAGYFAKVPVKKALSEAGLAEMTGAEQFWYVLQCIAFGAGYFAKVPVKKALSEMSQAPALGYHAAPAVASRPDYGRLAQAPEYDQPWEDAPPRLEQGPPTGRHHSHRQNPGQHGY